jgi:hypothetical protein
VVEKSRRLWVVVVGLGDMTLGRVKGSRLGGSQLDKNPT